MLYPTISELTKGEYNRYELALATAKCARIITGEYVRQREAAERSMTGNKDTDRPQIADVFICSKNPVFLHLVPILSTQSPVLPVIRSEMHIIPRSCYFPIHFT